MRDYNFGEYLTKLRLNSNLSQNDVARVIGVTNKAVSKWENGVSKPTVDNLRVLCKLFGVSVENMLKIYNNEKEKNITKIVVTGGSCAGKTTALTQIQSHFEKQGYAVLFVSEIATDLILGGISPATMDTMLDFEKAIIRMQLTKEKVFEQAAKKIKNTDKVLIVCDRGALDIKAFLGDFEWRQLLKNLGLVENELRDGYDAVFHLVTTAKGAPQFYTHDNNSARYDTLEQAKLQDDKLIQAWTGHNHLRIIDNSVGFDDKMKNLLKEISSFLGEPVPYEIERKFLIKYPNIKTLEKIPECKKVEIIQTYLQSSGDEEVRIRQRGSSDGYTYTKTTKKKISETKRVEYEKRLTQSEYLDLLMQADPSKNQIRKTRYCLVYKNQYFEIDTYPFWSKQAIMEIELNDENQKIELPNFVEVIREVTNEPSFKNANLAQIGAVKKNSQITMNR